MDDGLLKRKSIAECRICHDEDESTNLETPCACCGSLKFAHRECVQRWCNEKGDTTCEICRQNFEPGYTAPPHLFQFAALPLPLRANWEIPRRNTQGNFMLMIPTDRDFLEPNLDLHVSHATVICYRVVATIFVVLLILRHALPIIISEVGDYSVKLYSLFILGTIGVLVPAFLILKAISTLYRRRQRYRQASAGNIESAANDEMNNPLRLQPQLHLIHIQ
ncbi:hypothetical protein V2J09_012622 [Rumex salicifolius]